MKSPRFSDLSAEEQDWLENYLNGTIDSEAFELFQNRIVEKPELRVVMRRYLALDHALQERSDEAELRSDSATAPWLWSIGEPNLAPNHDTEVFICSPVIRV